MDRLLETSRGCCAVGCQRCTMRSIHGRDGHGTSQDWKSYKGIARKRRFGPKAENGRCCLGRCCSLEECLADAFQPLCTRLTCTYDRIQPTALRGMLCGCNAAILHTVLLHWTERWYAPIQPFNQVHYHRVSMPMRLVDSNGAGKMHHAHETHDVGVHVPILELHMRSFCRSEIYYPVAMQSMRK